MMTDYYKDGYERQAPSDYFRNDGDRYDYEKGLEDRERCDEARKEFNDDQH